MTVWIYEAMRSSSKSCSVIRFVDGERHVKHMGKLVDLLMPLAMLLVLSACGPSSDQSNNAVPPNKGPAPVIVLDNTAPANIDFALTAGIVQSDPKLRATFEIAPAFYYQKTQIIQFKHGEKLQCNGIVLPTETGRGYVTETLPAPGTVMDCIYVSPQGQASFPLPFLSKPNSLHPLQVQLSYVHLKPQYQ